MKDTLNSRAKFLLKIEALFISFTYLACQDNNNNNVY